MPIRSTVLVGVLLLGFARPPEAPACDTGSCPPLTQSQDSVRTTLDLAIGIGTRF